MRKPAPALETYMSAVTSLRVSYASHEALCKIRETLVEWHLGHADPEVRRAAIDMTTDHALRIVLATFARDYRIAL